MNTGKIVRNAGSHRILHALSFGMKSGRELKQVVGSINSVARFEGEYMARLMAGGYVRKVLKGWTITRRGEEMLVDLGELSGMPRKKPNEATVMNGTTYIPDEHNRTPLRPGAEDFLKWPSRMGKRLFYRDGTVKEIDDGH